MSTLEPLPLDEVFDLDTSVEVRQRNHDLQEQGIAECIRAEGFEYFPVQYGILEEPEVSTEVGSLQTQDGSGDFEFGLLTRAYSQEQVGPGLLGHDGPELDEPDVQQSQKKGPNGRYLESLDPASRKAYDEAYYGIPSPDGLSAEEYGEFLKKSIRDGTAGCWHMTVDNINPLSPEREQMLEVVDEYYQVESDALENDPRIVAHEAQVAKCVTDLGFDAPTQENREKFFYEGTQLVDAELASVDASPARRDDLTGAESEVLAREYEQSLDAREFTPEAKRVLGELQQYELAWATAFYRDCGGTQPYDTPGIYREVIRDVQERFIEQNPSLELWLAEQRAKRDAD